MTDVPRFLKPASTKPFMMTRLKMSNVTIPLSLQDIDGNGRMKVWRTVPAPELAIRYWQLDVRFPFSNLFF